MSTITRERLTSIVFGAKRHPGSFTKLELELAEHMLASLEAEAVAYADPQAFRNFQAGAARREWMWRNTGEDLIPLFTTKPAPVSVTLAIHDEDFEKALSVLNDTLDDCGDSERGLLLALDKAGIEVRSDACRAAMLQGADGNSPVIPDGWVLVPVEPTEDMIVNGFESEPDESFSDEKEWATYDAMSGCQQAAHRAKLCWAAMIAAAPKTEHK
ncbi:hypothetical protein [Enterobacter ludwigii]|uniref:hypothetical protein n=1 Tax=Enterobacter ludwigii TaxID=299767 RepID=UPI0021AB82C5|nr:hypothetical protein [Enterobacter ludwigii]